jgi:hypothetical protein
MTKQTIALLGEMLLDFEEDINAKLSNIPSSYLDKTFHDITVEFARLTAMYPREFKEKLFRVSVANIASTLPTLALADTYRYNQAFTQVANEYNRTTKHSNLQRVA